MATVRDLICVPVRTHPNHRQGISDRDKELNNNDEEFHFSGGSKVESLGYPLILIRTVAQGAEVAAQRIC